MKKSLADGKGSLEYFGGEKRYCGEFRNDESHGVGTCDDDEGKYVGQWDEGEKHGDGIQYFADGGKYVG